MEYRKLISFGKNSFVVSLPKNWVRQNKLVKGDLIYIEENGPKLLLSHKGQSVKIVEKEKTINIDGKSKSWVKREINASYILNYRKIIIKGKEVRKRIKELQETFQNLIALEVMEQTQDTIIAKDFLNMKKVSVEELVRKIDVVIRAMFRDACESFSQETHETLQERDKSVNRLYYLLYRAVLYNLDNSLVALKNFNLTPIALLNYQYCAFYLEGVADEVRRTARFTCQIKVNAKEKKELQQYLEAVQKYYLDTMKSLYSKEEKTALDLSTRKKELNNMLDPIQDRNKKVENYLIMASRIRRLLSYIHNLGRTIYQGFNY